MKDETKKKIVSVLSSIEGDLISKLNDEDALLFVKWANKLLSDTVKDRKEKEIQLKINDCKDENEKKKLKIKKKNYLPINYPYDLEIGDIVHIDYGFGYCGELSNGHYGIILSGIRVNKYFVIPLSSEPLKIHSFYFENLGLPDKNGYNPKKKSHCRFDQLCHIHYRRIENVDNGNRKKLSEENLMKLFCEINKFLKITVYKSENIEYNNNVPK